MYRHQYIFVRIVSAAASRFGAELAALQHIAVHTYITSR
jgi:hypothetical protein